MESQFMDTVLINLRLETGLQAEWKPDTKDEIAGRLRLYNKMQEFTYNVAIENVVRLYQLDKIIGMAAKHFPFMVIADRILPPVKKALKEKGIAYIEGNGDAHMQNGPFYIHINKNLPIRPDRPVTNRAFTKTGLKAVFYFLNTPNAINNNYRKIAADTGIALGNVKYIIDGLADAGYILKINKKDIQLKNKSALLERWVAGYQETLRPSLLIGTFNFPNKQVVENWKNLDLGFINAAWGGQPAGEILTDYLKAVHLQIYTPAPKIQIMQHLQLIPDKNGTLDVYKQFWLKIEDTPAQTVPVLLVYTDLLITDDPRCIETAEYIYQKYLNNEFKND